MRDPTTSFIGKDGLIYGIIRLPRPDTLETYTHCGTNTRAVVRSILPITEEEIEAAISYLNDESDKSCVLEDSLNEGVIDVGSDQTGD